MFLHWLSSFPGLVHWIRILTLDLIELRSQHILHLKECKLLMRWVCLASSPRWFTVPASTRDETAGSEILLPVSWMLWVWGQAQLVCQHVVHLQFPQSSIPSKMKQCPEKRGAEQYDAIFWLCDSACTLHPMGRMVVRKQRGNLNSDKKGSREQRYSLLCF